MSSKIKLENEIKKNMIEEIKYYFQKERDEELGDLAAGLILDFFIEKIGPEIYNQGVYDSYQLMTDRVEDLLAIQKK
ncbi:DUF2164 domain-containing protein [Proteinivorax hydrogeniformans]|uniref:DUF2164 domain-containing protein n=1 Tax=Proteinivorax hydrogeniformans TaxID=1826727 RepID=A0AAU8HST1_9FIRM